MGKTRDHFKKIRYTKGTFHAKMDTIKDRNGMDLSSCPKSLPASGSTLHMRWPKYWSFSFSIIPSKEIPGLISFRKDWLDLLAVQGTLKSILQHHSSKASVPRHSVFFTVQLSHPYMTTGKIARLNFLECEIKWALGSIAMNKASRGDGIPAELF